MSELSPDFRDDETTFLIIHILKLKYGQLFQVYVIYDIVVKGKNKKENVSLKQL